MPLDIDFVDENADGPDLPLRTMGRNAHRVGSVKEFVDDVLLALGPNNCISRLRLIGHGSPGSINVGSGRERDPQGRQSINIRNTQHWVQQLARLACKFCPDGEFELVGCNTGAGMLGARLLTLIANTIRCARVKAPVEPISALMEALVEWQEAGPVPDGQERVTLPEPIDADRLKTSSLVLPGGTNVLVGGAALASLIHYDPSAIVAARFLPATGRGPKVSAVRSLSKRDVSMISSSFKRAQVAIAPLYLFAVEGYLQIQIRTSKKSAKWIPAGALIGGCSYYSPFGADTTIAYELLPQIGKRLLKLT